MKKAFCLAAILCLFAAVPADAQNRRAGWELGVHGGYVFFDTDVDDSFSIGGAIGINATDWSEIEFDFNFVDTDTATYGIDTEVMYFSLGYIYNHHPGGKLASPHVPYIQFGFGKADYDVKADGIEDPDYDFIYIGGGYRYFWMDVFGFRWDVRGIFYGDDGSLGDAFKFENVDVSTYIGLTWVVGG